MCAQKERERESAGLHGGKTRGKKIKQDEHFFFCERECCWIQWRFFSLFKWNCACCWKRFVRDIMISYFFTVFISFFFLFAPLYLRSVNCVHIFGFIFGFLSLALALSFACECIFVIVVVCFFSIVASLCIHLMDSILHNVLHRCSNCLFYSPIENWVAHE